MKKSDSFLLINRDTEMLVVTVTLANLHNHLIIKCDPDAAFGTKGKYIEQNG